MSLYEIKISGLNSFRLIIKICRKKQTKESLLLKGTYNRTKNHLKCIKVLQIKIFFDEFMRSSSVKTKFCCVTYRCLDSAG